MRGKRGIFLAVLFCSTAFGDTVELKTGERIEGTFKQAGAAGAVIEVGGKPLTFEIEKVRAIFLGSGAPAMLHAPPASAEAIDALRMLRSVTTSGINYRDYATRVLDAKVAIDRYRDSGSSDPAREPILAAMRYYEMGSQAWGLRVSSGGASGAGRMTEIGAQIRSDSCGEFAGFVASTDSYFAKSKRPVSDQEKNGFLGSLAGGKVSLFWKCGSDKVAEAESSGPR